MTPDDGTPKDLIALGVVTAARGLRGEVRLKLWNSESTTLDGMDAVWLRRGADVRRAGLLHLAPGKGGTLSAAFEGVTTIDAAEALRGTEVCVRRADLPPLEEGEWYHVDLIGLEVRDGEGAALGRVEDVVEYPTVSCLAVRAGDERREVPMVPPYLVRVDLRAGVVEVAEWADLAPDAPRSGKQEGR